MRLYVAGPVTGIPDLNRPAFENAARRLRGAGHFATIPHELVPSSATWEEAMALCVPALQRFDGLALLDGWHESKGACLEADEAARLGLSVGSVFDWVCVA